MIDEIYAKCARKITLGNMPSPRTELTFEQLKIYYEEKGLKLGENFKKNLDLVMPDDIYNYIAYLLSDSNGTSIKVAKYAGKDKVDLIENEEYGYCSLIKATYRVLEKLTVENRTFAKITPKARLEKKMVDRVALREAVINAIVHNDYTKEVPPVFEIFADRITITSYGGLVEGLTKEDFLSCLSMPRNRELMRIFRDVDLVEQLGSGMSRILKAYDESIFRFTPNFLIVTMPFEDSYNKTDKNEPVNNVNEPVNNVNEPVNNVNEPVNNVNEPVNSVNEPVNNVNKHANSVNKHANSVNEPENNNNETLNEIMNFISKNKNSSKKSIADETGRSRATITRLIKELKVKNQLQRIGSDKSGYWKIIEHEDNRFTIDDTNHEGKS